MKNKFNILPLNISKVLTIGIFGDAAYDKPIYAGTGSGGVIGYPKISPLEALVKRTTGKNITLKYVNSKNTETALKLAKDCDLAIIFAGDSSSEFGDRMNLSLSNN